VIKQGMRVLIPARHGLGDVLAGYFIAERGRSILAKVRSGLATGQIASAMVVYEDSYNPSTGDLFRALPFDLMVRKTSDLPEIANQDTDNRMPAAVRWHQNVYTNPPAAFADLDGSQWVECPTRTAPFEVPDDFVLFSDGASSADRSLTDCAIYPFLRDVMGLPVVKVGHGHDIVPADINLCNKLNIVETLYLGKRARIVVSGLTMLRTFSALFGTPVIELAEQPSAETIRRTRWEYAGGLYGMKDSLNRWFRWPADRERISAAMLQLGRSCHGR
jgi:hypothetical protein